MKRKINQLVYKALCTFAIMFLTTFTANYVWAQKGHKPLNPALQNLAKGGSNANWIDFREGTTIQPTTIFNDYKQGFELSDNDLMKVDKIKKDEIGYNHYRYQQYYKNLKVLFGEYIVHQNATGFVKSANGRLITGLQLSNTPSVSEKQALDGALAFMNAKKYLWQNAEMEAELKRHEKNNNATYFPKGELLYAPIKIQNPNAQDYKLAWHFKIYTDDLNVLAKSVYVDALTGKVINHVDIAMNCSGGTGASGFNGTVSVSTQLSGGSYRSLNDCQTTQIRVYNCNGGGASNTYYTDADNTWTNASAVQAQWGAAHTYNYFNLIHNRQSWDGANGDMISYNNSNAPGLGVNNACWGCTGNSTIYGAGSTAAATDDWNTNDIMGHEFAHGVTQAAAGLVYSYESGALNESFSDIFGEMVESASEGYCDYFVGADRGAIRNMANPNQFNDPDTYLGTNWATGTGDNGGVHTNSGVQNYWFYLLSEGGSGTTDFGVPFSVTGITRFKARQIAYRALDLYLTSSSQYIDARAATLRAAFDLYGQCSAEIIAVGDAWHAVGVESQSAQFVNSACGTFSNGEFRQAISQLNSGGSGCVTTVNSAINTVVFTARDRVVLSPGFTAVAGSKFVAYLEPCSSTMWKNGSDIPPMSDIEKGIKTTLPIVAAKETTEKVLSTSDRVSVYPNPFVNNFEITVQAREDAKVQINLFNSLGSKVNEKAGIVIRKGSNKISFDGSTLSKGVYMIEVNVNGEKTIKKIMKL